MAVALATLPLKRVLACDGDTLLTTGAGAGTGFATGLAATLTGLLIGLATVFGACFAVGLTGAATFLASGLAAGFAVALLAALPLGLVFFTTTFFGAGFLTATFLTAAFLATGFLAGLAFFGCTLATTFLTAALATGFFVAGFAVTFLALPAGLATAWTAFAGFLTGFLLVLFTASPFAAAAFDLPALATFALTEVFLCAVAAVELRVVFAISLHRFWPWRPGVIAHVFYTSKLASGILVPLTCCKPFRQREFPDTLDTVVAAFVQALAQPSTRTTLPIPPQLL